MNNEFKLYPVSKFIDFSAISLIQLNRLQKKDLVAVEVGAFKGDDAEVFYRNFGQRLTFYPIEACPVNFNYLKKRFKRFKKTIKLRNLIISNIDGKEKFYTAVCPKYKENISSQANSLYKSFLNDKLWVEDCREVKLPSLTLNTFCKIEEIDCIDLLKLNCEGGEYRIFSGRKLPFLKKVSILDIAIHGKNQQFLQPNFIQQKRHINKRLVTYGFKLICGYNLNDLKFCPVNHVRQIWIRSKAPWK